MVEQLVLLEMMELNSELSSMTIIEEEQNVTQKIVEVLEVDENKSKTQPRRSLRKRIRPLDTESNKHQDSIKIQKLSNDIGDVEKYYLCKKVKRLPSTLETIFEEPKEQNDTQQYLSTRKFKRALRFEEDLACANRLKLRKRQIKAKKLASSKKFLNRKKISMDTFLRKLSSIDSDNE